MIPMTEVSMRPHHAALLNFLASVHNDNFMERKAREQLSHGQYSRYADDLIELGKNFPLWNQIAVNWIIGSDWFCRHCIRFDQTVSECGYHYPQEDESVRPEMYRAAVDREFLLRVPTILSAKNVHQAMVIANQSRHG